MIEPQGVAHIGIAVQDLEAAVAMFERQFGARAGAPFDVPEQGVRMAYMSIGGTIFELLAPISEASPLTGFLRRNPSGGLHHVALRVADAHAAAQSAQMGGLALTGSGVPVKGHHGREIFFVHPKMTCGVLLEIEQAPGDGPES